ncbi:hypothetical protein C7N43_22955 [Sphingobacteriales bacterium UPWRP_1]|nr:hypothetical protein B6N25_15010 [Sphingobacteriales bacterium TSM_CSS]PSJ74652.1 hypothetical protein C7N43_22955 [Sphingobacteriales bacterium UPWRP_1]
MELKFFVMQFWENNKAGLPATLPDYITQNRVFEVRVVVKVAKRHTTNCPMLPAAGGGIGQ